ncbi:probable ATP-dependent RNA helicase DHX35 [Strongylocentrotus purpuratus]|uniref:RNA helicase n=1 Tax=Strongylocentrotus purpuratus TaxID=7668 RepID=A0A7M7SU99_STRPU|nr:probable ATP-dependent RNA helicase DHX35 [Strongylocentrotus purpuratus]
MASGSVPKFWKPGTAAPGEGLKEERSGGSGQGETQCVVFNQYVSLSIEQQRQRLPVFKHRNHILYLLERYQTLVVVGETGSGKSTQIPQYLVEAGWGAEGHVIGVTQPRRVAAVTVAQRVAEERGAIIGHEVGYAIRFEDCADPQSTKVKFMTDGYLLREMMRDPLLKRYSVLMLDEAHERTLFTDIIVGLLKKIQRKRPELRIIIASATLDAESFRNFFNQNSSKDKTEDTAAILTVEGRTYPVDIFYATSPVPDYLKAVVETIMKIHKSEPKGDILAFLPGQDEVENVLRMVIDQIRVLRDSSMKMMALPMYGSLPANDQMRVFENVGKNTRKVVIATNIAETSITINGIGYVIDGGFVRIKAFNAKNSIEGLVTVPVSQASAQQRAGRAGRVRSGKAYRLYTEEDFMKLPKTTVPEMQRSNLGTAILQLKCLGIDNVLRFPFLSPPSSKAMVRGLELLYALGGLNDHAKLSEPLGVRMAELPVNPMLAKMLLVSGEYGCSEEILTIAAMLQVNNVFQSPANQRNTAERAKRKFGVKEGDHLTLLNVHESFIKYKKNSRWCRENFLNSKALIRALAVREQLKKLLKKFKVKMVSSEGDMDTVLRCIVAGFFPNAAHYHPSGEYRTIRDDYPLHIHPSSVLYTQPPPRWVVYNEVLQTSKDYMRDVTVVKSSWLSEIAPHFYQFGTVNEIAAKRQKTDG